MRGDLVLRFRLLSSPKHQTLHWDEFSCSTINTIYDSWFRTTNGHRRRQDPRPPPEIIQRIFIHLDGKGLATLCRTSQFFQLIAKRELYGRELHISCCVDPITWTPRSGKFGEVKALCRALYWSSSGPSRRLGYVQSLTLGDIR